MRTRERTWIRLLAVLMSIGLVAMACGSDDDDTEETAATSTTEAAGDDSPEPADDDAATEGGDQSAEAAVTENKALVPDGAEWGETREFDVDGDPQTYIAYGALVPDGQLPPGWETRYEGNADWTVVDVSYGSIRQVAEAAFDDDLCMLEVVQTGQAGFWVWWVFATATACNGVWPLALLDQLSAAPAPNVQ